MARAIAGRETMASNLAEVSSVVQGAVQVEAVLVVPADLVSAGREDRGAVVQECGRVAMGAAVVRVDLVPPLALGVTFLGDSQVAFLVDRECFRKTPKWPH
jgi:hypothetical protein